MGDYEDDPTYSLELELSETKSDLKAEQSFRKVYFAVGILSFLYGLCYGVYLSK